MRGIKKHQRAPTAFQEPGTFEAVEFSRHRLAARAYPCGDFGMGGRRRDHGLPAAALGWTRKAQQFRMDPGRARREWRTHSPGWPASESAKLTKRAACRRRQGVRARRAETPTASSWRRLNPLWQQSWLSAAGRRWRQARRKTRRRGYRAGSNPFLNSAGSAPGPGPAPRNKDRSLHPCSREFVRQPWLGARHIACRVV